MAGYMFGESGRVWASLHHLAVLVFLCHHIMAPLYLAHDLCCSCCQRLIVLRTILLLRVTAAHAWNSLPASITAADSLTVFKRQLKTDNSFHDCIFLQRVGIACYASAVCATGVYVPPSICPSVTSWYCVESNEVTIMRFSPSGSTIILVSGEVKIVWKFAGDHP